MHLTVCSYHDCNATRTYIHLVHKRALNYLAKLAKRLSCVLSTYLHDAFGYVFLSTHVHVVEWIYTLLIPKFQANPCWNQTRYLKFNWLQQDSNSQPVSSQRNTLPFCQIGQMIELRFEYISLRCTWLCLLIMSSTPFRVNPPYIATRMTMNSLIKKRCNIGSLNDCNGTQTSNNLIWKQSLDHLAKRAKRLSSVLNTYLYGPFHWVLLFDHVCVSEWIHSI